MFEMGYYTSIDLDLNKVSNRMPTDKIAWYKVNENQLAAYREALAANLAAMCPL